jgi:hypothetical protein
VSYVVYSMATFECDGNPHDSLEELIEAGIEWSINGGRMSETASTDISVLDPRVLHRRESSKGFCGCRMLYIVWQHLSVTEIRMIALKS